ncbi:MAG TPA: DNA mismatch repair protein MutS [Candidatus Eremiobacteraceae bacterium]|nr:DNA mismatch repair protein MutS [Candidatus Eremiobacteraceae bacterium]
MRGESGSKRRSEASPLFAQYEALKGEYPEALLLSRVGDFYEAYGDDAEDLARSLQIILTSKEAGGGRRIAMAGVPHHSVDVYLARLMRQRRVVAIAEQMEQPVPNRLVRREIVRVMTPGTVVDERYLEPDRNNYICAFARTGRIALAYADVSTAESAIAAFGNDDELSAELDRIAPSEVVVENAADEVYLRSLLPETCRVGRLDPDDGRPENGEVFQAARPFGDVSADEQPAVERALGLLARYLRHVKIDTTPIFARIRTSRAHGAMLVDPATRRHLDLIAGSGDDAKASVLSVLARTRTPMGGRLLAARLRAPLVDVAEINRRLDRVQAFVERVGARLAAQEALAGVGDIERVVQKARARRATPRDLALLRRSLQSCAMLQEPLAQIDAAGCAEQRDRCCGAGAPATLLALLERSLADDPPATFAEGGVFRKGYSVALDELADLRVHARERLSALETATRARSGLRTLRVKYTQAFGYYFEVPRAHAESVPVDFARRSSLVNAERFTNVELKELESEILSSRSRQSALERELFDGLLADVDRAGEALLDAAAAIAGVDVECSLAQVAGERRYVRPLVTEERVIDVDSGRHPVVEAFGTGDFVANDCRVDDERRFLLITGPNMGGKSTYLRQTALLSILAQIGSFVPARRARLGVVDRVFTRIGAGDDIAAGRSTFFVEMSEMALILRRCTARSLLLIDEVGRGTGTTDGLAIAQAICEHLLGLRDRMPSVLFATHFHELVALANVFPVIQNLHVGVADDAPGLVFSHRVLHGASSRSYGIAVGQMAGLPDSLVARAGQIADELESRPEPRPGPLRRTHAAAAGDDQLNLGL